MRPPLWSRLGPRALLVALGVLVGLCLAEWVLRAMGSPPYAPSEATFRVTPGDWALPDPDFGWSLSPGSYRFTFRDGYSARSLHDAEARRVTPPGTGPVLELHGGSFAYGLGLEDEDSLGWRLQERLPHYDVRTRAVPGHGPLQAWFAMQDHAREGTAPHALVVTYVEFHDERVTWNRSWRRALSGRRLVEAAGAPGMPAVRNWRGPPTAEFVDPRLRPLPGARSSSVVALVDRLLDRVEEHRRRSWIVTRNLLVELHSLAKEHGTSVLVVGLSSDPRARANLEDLDSLGVLTLDAGLDWTAPENQLWPHDPHPSAEAADRWARAIADVVGGRPGSSPVPARVVEKGGSARPARR